jgi:AcrR family transcriptional regulator
MRARMKERRERHKRELRQTILEAATELFEQQGYEGFSLRQVAEAIGYSATTIYLYFKDRDDLLHAVCRQGFERFSHDLAQAFDSTSDPLERLRALSWAYCCFGLDYPLYYRVQFMGSQAWLQRLYDEVAQTEAEGGRTPRSLNYQAVQLALEAGVLRPGDPRRITHVIWAGQHGLLGLYMSMNGVVPGWERQGFEPMFAEWIEATLRGLQT